MKHTVRVVPAMIFWQGVNMTKKYVEKVLDDDYPVYAGFLYVIDGIVSMSEMSGTVGQLKKLNEAEVITTCDIVGRDLW